MYESYWQLKCRPFESNTDPEFYYPSEGHQGALLKLRYAIENTKGAALLVADHGAGKTMVVEMLRSQLPEQADPFVHLVFPRMPAADLLAYLADELSAASSEPKTIENSVRRIEAALKANAEQDRHTVVCIDEGHLLEDPECWHILRLLCNFHTAGKPPLTFLLVGQMPLLSNLNRMPAWEERLAVKCLLKPFTLEETAAYVQHRLDVAGGRPEIFTPEAVESLHRLAEGMPRRINRLADLSLVIGFAEELQQIGAPEVESVCQELIAVSAA